MLPIFALAETQSWRRDDYSVSLRCESEHVINAFLATVDRDKTLPANSAEDAWFDAATVGLDGVKRPSWTMAREVWLLLAERLGVRLSFRQLHCDKGRPDLAALLLAEPGSSRIMHVDPATTLGLFERLSAWSPHTLAWLSAAIRGVR